MDLARLQQDSAQVANALLREQHLVVCANHASSSSTIPRSGHFIPDGSSRPEGIRLQRQLLPHGIEDHLRWADHAIHLEVLDHDREDVEISGRRFRGDKTTPDEDAAQSSSCCSELQQRSEAPNRISNSRQLATCTPAGNSPSSVKSGSTITR